MSDLALVNRYRPKTFDEVVGHRNVVASIKRVLEQRSSRTFLFTGISGGGKTTLARIIAAEVGCDPANLMEVDAATHSGADDVRQITERVNFRGMTGSSTRVVIMDECHVLSKTAVQALLKATEEPPPHVWWFLLTTEADKVPETIRNRATRYDLQPVEIEDIYGLVQRVAAAEKMETPEEVLAIVARKSQGSPRRALSGLAACASAGTKAEALSILQEVDTDDGDVRKLCQLLLKGASWDRVIDVVKGMKDKNPESIRIVVCAYFSAVAMGAHSAKTERALEVLSAFERPYPQQSQMAPLLLSLARLILTE